jgi:hypothetical protein
MAISFVTMVTGISLQLHLSSHGHQHEHDSGKCSICQQLLTVPGKFIVEPETDVHYSDPLGSNVVFRSQSFVLSLQFEPFTPRPPPQILYN